VIKNALSLKNEPSLFIKVAQVLVAAHHYDEAIKYYNKSGTLKAKNNIELNYVLYLKYLYFDFHR